MVLAVTTKRRQFLAFVPPSRKSSFATAAPNSLRDREPFGQTTTLVTEHYTKTFLPWSSKSVSRASASVMRLFTTLSSPTPGTLIALPRAQAETHLPPSNIPQSALSRIIRRRNTRKRRESQVLTARPTQNRTRQQTSRSPRHIRSHPENTYRRRRRNGKEV